MRNVSDKFLEKTKTRFMFSNFFPKIFRFKDKVEKYCRGRQAADDNTAQVHCLLDN
jgi:hypothetical protein